MWSETTLPCHTAGILLLFSDLLHQLRVGGALDDLVELGAVVPHEAHAADHDVARAPALAAVDHPKGHGNRSLAGADLRLHGGLVAVNAVDTGEELVGRLAGPRRRCQHRPKPEGRYGDHAPRGRH